MIVFTGMRRVGFYDWADMLPFYERKFLSVGKEEDVSRYEEKTRKLFEVAFPEFVVNDASTLIKILTDKRVRDLRQLVQDAIEGKTGFDHEFAKNVYKDVFSVEVKISRYRNIASYVTLPLDIIPWVSSATQLLTEEALGRIIEKKLKKKHQWFYMLSDYASSDNSNRKLGFQQIRDLLD